MVEVLAIIAIFVLVFILTVIFDKKYTLEYGPPKEQPIGVDMHYFFYMIGVFFIVIFILSVLTAFVHVIKAIY